MAWLDRGVAQGVREFAMLQTALLNSDDPDLVEIVWDRRGF